MRLRRLRTAELSPAEVVEIRAMLDAAFGDDEEERFTDPDWEHSVGGLHFVLDVDGPIVSHASVVERELQVAGRPFRTGYVEAVATRAGPPGRGFGTTVMREITAYIRETFELGALGTGSRTSTSGSAGRSGQVRRACEPTTASDEPPTRTATSWSC